ncbi:hypothetical protein QM012_007783 [Aureobasidium pullulans]|uniref:Uncharacterized protein n=1 Tax=Aureobasidium pullulans TaxID=5580 RepID=A0ABR0TL76_AURPU
MGVIELTANASPKAPTSVIVEFYTGRCLRLIVPYPTEPVIASLRQPPTFNNTIRSEIIERVYRTMFDSLDLIKRISLEDAHIELDTATSNIEMPTCDVHSWDNLETSVHFSYDPDDECYTPKSETSREADEYSSNDEEPLLSRTASSDSRGDASQGTTGWSTILRELYNTIREQPRKSLLYCFTGFILHALWLLLQVATATANEHGFKLWDFVTKSFFY